MLNLDYMYDGIGEDLNELCDSFRNWAYNEEEITQLTSEECYLNSKSTLYIKLLSFNNKFAIKFKDIHSCSFQLIINFLMSFISKKCGKTIVAPYHASKIDNYVVMLGPNYCPGNYVKIICISLSAIYEIVTVWNELKDTRWSKSYVGYDRILIKDIKHFISLENETLVGHLLKYVYFDDLLCLNMEYLQEKLITDFDDCLTKTKCIIGVMSSYARDKIIVDPNSDTGDKIIVDPNSGTINKFIANPNLSSDTIDKTIANPCAFSYKTRLCDDKKYYILPIEFPIVHTTYIMFDSCLRLRTIFPLWMYVFMSKCLKISLYFDHQYLSYEEKQMYLYTE